MMALNFDLNFVHSSVVAAKHEISPFLKAVELHFASKMELRLPLFAFLDAFCHIREIEPSHDAPALLREGVR